MMDNDEFIKTTYYSTLETALSTGYSYLNNTIHWAISLQSALIVFLVSQKTFPNITSSIALSFSLVMVAHFATRSCKGYLNVIRWSVLQREVLSSVKEGRNLDQAYIQNYHIEWKSPLSYRDCISKLMLELGYVYLFGITITLAIYSVCAAGHLVVGVCSLAIGIILVIIEFIILRKSPYFKSELPDITAVRLK